MSPTSYQTAPSRDNKFETKEDVGFEPTHAVTRLTVFKTVPLSHLGNPPKFTIIISEKISYGEGGI